MVTRRTVRRLVLLSGLVFGLITAYHWLVFDGSTPGAIRWMLAVLSPFVYPAALWVIMSRFLPPDADE